ncbi:MAG: transcription elongation factor GreA [Bacilli bacterium]|nr:transcription elongation factor GreA [Bacilli bacterium]
MTEKTYLTIEGLENLKKELDELKNVKRPEIIQALKDARAQGDLSENAEYDAARTSQAETEAKIQELEYILENYELIDKQDANKVVIGTTVELEYIDDNEIEKYSIVGSKEADPFNNCISNESPIGKAIMGAHVGDICKVSAPNGAYEVKILNIL